MTRLAQQAAYINAAISPAAKHSALSPLPAPQDDTHDTGVLDSGRKGTAPDFELEATTTVEELALLRAENADLRNRLDQNEQLLHAAVASEEVWLERQKEYEVLLEEKSDVIRSLHQKIQELQEGSEGQNLARADQLVVFKKELDARQAQLQEDEKSLVNQMRTMEMALSRDRAELARQRNDILRLQSDVHREIEVASRDAGLRERLATIRTRGSNGPGTGRAPKTEINIELPPELPASTNTQSPPAPPVNKVKAGSGMLRRIFGG
jgi:hypothetical protein